MTASQSVLHFVPANKINVRSRDTSIRMAGWNSEGIHVSSEENDPNIDWVEKDNYDIPWASPSKAITDEYGKNCNGVPAPSQEDELTESKSIAYHIGVLKDKIQSKQEHSFYMTCLNDIVINHLANRKRAKLHNKLNFSLSILDGNQEHHLPKKRLLVFEGPIISILTHVFQFIPDLDKKNKAIAWLMHPELEEQLIELFKSAFSFEMFWNKVIAKARKRISDELKVPQGSNYESIIPVIPEKGLKKTLNHFSHDICPFYHEKQLCSLKITDLQSPIRTILNKYNIQAVSSYDNINSSKRLAQEVFKTGNAGDSSSLGKSRKKRKR